MTTVLFRQSALALILSALILPPMLAGTTPALAASTDTTAGGWTAQLETPLAAPRQDVVNSVLWKCAGDRCTGPAQGSRPVFVCQKVVRKLGPVARFASPDGELPAADLARCNGR